MLAVCSGADLDDAPAAESPKGDVLQSELDRPWPPGAGEACPALSEILLKASPDLQTLQAIKEHGKRLAARDDCEAHHAAGVTICMGGDRVYFLESRNPSAESLTTGQIGSQLWTDLYMVALNSETGARLWQKNLKSPSGADPVVTNGTAIIHLMYSDETLVLESSDTQYYFYAYDASDG